MVTINKNILRSILILSYINVVIIIVVGISKVFCFLNTGADRSKMLHTELKKIEQYIPQLEWAPLENEGRPMDMQTLKAIETDYLDAWYVKHIAYKTNTTNGIKDYYTKNARTSIVKLVDKNKLDSIRVDATTLSHHITLDFFSEDGQLAVITDKDVSEYKRIYHKNKLVLESKEQATYKAIILLEDGFWRIRHLKKTAHKILEDSTSASKIKMDTIKGINYYPQATPWNMYGDAFDSLQIAKDFKIISNAGLNTIRIFVPYEDFGAANVKPKKLEKIKTVLNIAAHHNLKVMVTLFDFFGDYEVINWTLNRHHAATLVTALKDHKALLAWDVKNEPNLDFESRGQPKVLAWLDNIIDLVKSTDTLHPVTIGWSNAKSAHFLKHKIDFVSFHYYEDLEYMETTYTALKKDIAKPIVITEFGLSSNKGVWHPLGSTEKDQANYHKYCQNVFAKHNIPFISWTLYDFSKVPKEVVGRLPWRKQTQEHFGFINQKGETKPAFKYISTK
jgi:hypothetical protein